MSKGRVKKCSQILAALSLTFLTGTAHPAGAAFLHNSPALTGESNQIKSNQSRNLLDLSINIPSPPRCAMSGDAHPTSPNPDSPPSHTPALSLHVPQSCISQLWHSPSAHPGCCLWRAALLPAVLGGPGGWPGCQRRFPTHCTGTGTPGSLRRGSCPALHTNTHSRQGCSSRSDLLF